MPAASSDDPGLLAGVRVLSFGAFVAGSSAGRLMADLGADVVKIEARSHPEVLRTPAYAIGEAFLEPSGVSNTVMYATLIRGMRSLSIDMARPDARALFHRLVANSDVVIENFARPLLPGWGCGFQDLLLDNPRLVMLSLSGYGRTGPRAGYLAYASTICGYIGLTEAWDYTHGTLTDYVTGVTGAVATVAAVQRARAFGVPAYLDLAQTDAMAPVLAPLYVEPLNTGNEYHAVSNQVPGSWFSGVFSSRGDDAWVAVELEDEVDWNGLAEVIERPDLAVHSRSRAFQQEAALRAAFAAWSAQRSPHLTMHVLQKRGLAAVAVQNNEDIWRDPQLRARGFGEIVSQSDLGPVTYPTSAQRWTRSPGVSRYPPFRLGEHTGEILHEWLSMTDEELKQFRDSGTVFEAD